MAETENQTDVAALTVQLLSAYLANNSVASEDLAGLIRTTRAALVEDTAPVAAEPEAPTYTPAVSVRKSLASPDHIISLLDGKPYKTLKRHLSANGLTPDQYRERFGLPASYPMVAPSFAAQRREAGRIGLGRKRSAEAAPVAEVDDASDTVNTPANDEAPAKPRRGRPAGKRAAAKASAGAGTGAKAPGRKPKGSAKAGASEVADTDPAEAQVTETNASSAPTKASKRPATAKGTNAVRKTAAKTNVATKPRAADSAKATETVTDEVTSDEAPAAAPKRRGKVGLFGKAAGQGGASEPIEAGAPVSKDLDATDGPAGEAEADLKAPKKPAAKKRMARTPKSTASKPTTVEAAGE
ncbi:MULTISPECIES: MucR family transcriptional regulator [unclassified Novosphingobium]|uniref:MucR family transcriptional regulator n=1 Tax=unclassified Novosphingobium TaxID=2644732 RepID=UPI001358DD2C|nr:MULTISPECIES: MucR family transcriptional regulator [unclassified Novosphingobium]